MDVVRRYHNFKNCTFERFQAAWQALSGGTPVDHLVRSIRISRESLVENLLHLLEG